MKFGTKLIHNSSSTDKATGALSTPIYQVSTYHQEDIFANQEFQYSRSENPTRKALEDTIAKLEGGDRGFAFSSGIAAITSVLSIFSAGDHLVVCEDVYGGTYRATSTIFSRFNIEITFVDATNLDEIKNAIKENTRALYLETPSNPLLKITDLKGAVKIAKEKDLLVIIDNTFMTPYLLRPIEFGVDIVIHSGTKFIGGHSDVVSGLVVVKGEALSKRVYAMQNGLGAILGPQDSWLLIRGLKTLKIRMDYQQNNASKLAEWFENHSNVKEVFYPGLKGHKGGEILLSQCDGPGAVLSVNFDSKETATKFMKNVTLAAVAVSLGGVETIVSYPVMMSHASVKKEVRERLGITDSLVRISAGLEDFEDLIADFEKALK